MRNLEILRKLAKCVAILCVAAGLSAGIGEDALAQAGRFAGDWRSPALGGPGGRDFASRCAAGAYLTGLDVTSDDRIMSVRIICGQARGDVLVGVARYGPEIGRVGGSRESDACPAPVAAISRLSVAWDGFDLLAIWSLAATCVPVGAPALITQSPPVIRLSGNPLDDRGISEEPRRGSSVVECPEGFLAVGVHGRGGIFIDAIGLICAQSPITPPQLPAAPVMTQQTLPNGDVKFDAPTVSVRTGELGAATVRRLDWCRVAGRDCGPIAATAFCRRRDFRVALASPIATGVSPTANLDGGTCNGAHCQAFASITCSKGAPVTDVARSAPLQTPAAPQVDRRGLGATQGPAIGGASPHASIDPGTGAIRFGDGSRGVRPPSSATVCAAGSAPRGAGVGDTACVSPAIRARIAEENRHAAENRDPGGAYGPNSCRAGFVWREAIAGDVVCVTPAARAMARQENAASH